jgi:hypothetical protein
MRDLKTSDCNHDAQRALAPATGSATNARINRVKEIAKRRGIRLDIGRHGCGVPTWTATLIADESYYAWSPWDERYPNEQIQAMCEAIRWLEALLPNSVLDRTFAVLFFA